MNEEVSIINNNKRNEKIKKFLVSNKSILVSILMALTVIFISVYSFDKYRANQKKEISNKFNLITLEYSESIKEITASKLVDIVNQQDSTYSTLSLYFIVDNELISDQNKINTLFDILIEKTSLDEEIKNLVIYKKALFNADKANESDLLNILNPLINSKSIWRSHALFLMAEYFYSKEQKQKSKEFFIQIIGIENLNPDIKLQTEKRLNRDFE